mmetsp:Transcript_470/g.626  ORF Transcript_470/g.626 Transcript_470/m.626 type:complete len:157 (-) Transcript_470:366-836(-)
MYRLGHLATVIACCCICSDAWVAGNPKFRKTICNRLKTRIQSDTNEQFEEPTVFNAKKKKSVDNRDELLFEVVRVSPPPKVSLGIFALDKNTKSGDHLIAHDSKCYKVKKIRYLYKYRAGTGFVMTRKVAEAVDTYRLAQEELLESAMGPDYAGGS